MDLEINKLINNQASIVISELYDDIYAATVEVAHERGLSVVLAYPDAATPEERDNPQMKELKLKPGAAQPFYIEPSVDYTDDLIERLNAKFANETGDH
jgi:Skp family chaperone for outer membrane proteins